MKLFNNANILLLLFIKILLSCSTQTDNSTQKRDDYSVIYREKDSIICKEDEFLCFISELEEVKKLDERLKKHHLTRMVIVTEDSMQNQTEYLYHIQIGYDNGFRFVVDQNYYYNCNNKDIYYLNTLADSLIKVNK